MALRLQDTVTTLDDDHDPPVAGEWKGPKIVCTGWKKTGTSSIKRAYRAVGLMNIANAYQCRAPSCLNKYDATQDAFTCCSHSLVRKMASDYPADEVKFIHLQRDPKSWYKSVQAWTRLKGEHWQNSYSKLMGASATHEDEFVKKFNEHNAFVKNLFAKQPERLLVLDLEAGDPTQNMMEFCKFLGVDPSNNANCTQPFPHWNSNKKSKPYAEKKQKKLDAATSLKKLEFEDDLEDSEGVSDKWLHVDEDHTEFDDFDWDVMEKDFMQSSSFT